MTELVRYKIEHVSRYEYERPAARSVMWLCLEPRTDFDQNLRHFEAQTVPHANLSPETDSFGNNKHVITINFRHGSLSITTRSEVDTVSGAVAPDTIGTDAWDEIKSWTNSFEHWDFTHESPLTLSSDALGRFVTEHQMTPSSDPMESLLRLSHHLHRNFEYKPGSTNIASTIDDILQSKTGVCQDYTHVMIAIARSWGVPTRYVSGYMHVTGNDGEQSPATASHAWVECLLPNLGWFGFDPTNDTVADERHVRIAVGRDYYDVSPTRGVIIDGGPSNLEASVRMEALTSDSELGNL